MKIVVWLVKAFYFSGIENILYAKIYIIIVDLMMVLILAAAAAAASTDVCLHTILTGVLEIVL